MSAGVMSLGCSYFLVAAANALHLTQAHAGADQGVSVAGRFGAS